MQHLGGDPLPPGVYSDREAAIVRFSQALTHHPPRVSDALYADLASHFTREQVVQITFVVGQSAIVNRIHAAFLTDVDEATLEQLEGVACPIPIPPAPGATPVDAGPVEPPSPE